MQPGRLRAPAPAPAPVPHCLGVWGHPIRLPIRRASCSPSFSLARPVAFQQGRVPCCAWPSLVPDSASLGESGFSGIPAPSQRCVRVCVCPGGACKTCESPALLLDSGLQDPPRLPSLLPPRKSYNPKTDPNCTIKRSRFSVPAIVCVKVLPLEA